MSFALMYRCVDNGSKLFLSKSILDNKNENIHFTLYSPKKSHNVKGHCDDGFKQIEKIPFLDAIHSIKPST